MVLCLLGFKGNLSLLRFFSRGLTHMEATVARFPLPMTAGIPVMGPHFISPLNGVQLRACCLLVSDVERKT